MHRFKSRRATYHVWNREHSHFNVCCHSPRNCHRLLTPLYRGAWITLPIAVHLVEVNRRQAWEGTMCRFQNLMRLLYGLKIRFEGAQFLTKLIDSVIKTIARKQQECCTPHLDTPDGSPSDSSSHNAVSSVEVEADFLTCVSRLVDLALSNELLDEI